MAKRRKIPRYMGSADPKEESQLPVDVEKLCDKSKRSYALPDYYRSFDTRCIGCDMLFHVSAAEQKRIHENSKVYIFARINRCPKCQAEWRELKPQATDILQSSLATLSRDEVQAAFDLYNRYIDLGGHRSSSFEHAIRKRLLWREDCE